MKKKWFIVSKPCMEPALLAGTTAAPILRLNRSPFAFETYPARSIIAFISAVISPKYVGEPSRMTSALDISDIHLFTISSSRIHFPFFISKHALHAVQPCTGLPPSCRISVSNPSEPSSASTVSSMAFVLPSCLGLPLIASAFIFFPPSEFLLYLSHFLFYYFYLFILMYLKSRESLKDYMITL